MLLCKRIHGNNWTGVIDFHGDSQCVMRVLLKVTWIQWPLWGEKVSLHEKLKEHLVPKLWWWTGQVCYKLNCTTYLSNATPSKVTWIQWPLWGEKVSLHVHEKLKEHLVLTLCWWTGQVCYKLNVQLTCQVPRPPRSRESNDPFEEKRCHYMYMKSLRNILSSSYGGERACVLQIELHNSPVKCHALQGHVNPMTPLRWKGVTTWKA